MSRDPDTLVDLTTAANEFDAQVIAQRLEAEGIPARAFTTAGTWLRWDIASMQPMRIAVRRADLPRAHEALERIRLEADEIDWSQIDTGDRSALTEEETAPPEPQMCARCGADLTAVVRTDTCPRCGAATVPDRLSPRIRRRRRRQWVRFVGLSAVVLGLAVASFRVAMVALVVYALFEVLNWAAEGGTRPGAEPR